jgi:hypothetical protein
MREPPKDRGHNDHGGLTRLRGISIAALTFLPLGNDPASAVYRLVKTIQSLYAADDFRFLSTHLQILEIQLRFWDAVRFAVRDSGGPGGAIVARCIETRVTE